MSERELEKLISSYIPVPVCIINRQGKVVEASSRIGEVFLYDGIKDGDIFALTGVKTAELYDAAEKNIHPLLKRNEKIFRLVLQKADPEDDDSRAPIFRWRGHGNLLYSNWLNYFVYQTTPYDIMSVGQESTTF